MKHFNYNPLTFELNDGEEYWFISYYGVVNFIYSKVDEYDTIMQRMYGIYKTKEDANTALEIARDAIINNVKE